MYLLFNSIFPDFDIKWNPGWSEIEEIALINISWEQSGAWILKRLRENRFLK